MITWFAQSVSFFFYLLFFFLPIILFPKTSEIFEFNKIVFVYATVVIIVAAWITKMVLAKKIIFRRTSLDIPLLIFLASQILSTIFSLDPRTSIFGYYSRFHGGLLSTFSYSLLYWAFVSNMTKDNTKKILISLISSAYIVSAYAILQRIGIDKNFWDQDVQKRVFSTFGQPNWLAAWISAVIPLTWAYLISNYQFSISNFKNKKFLLLLGLSILFFLTLLFTKSRSGLLGFITAFAIFWGGLFLIRKGGKKLIATFALITSTLLITTFIAGSVWTPSLREVRSEKLEMRSEDITGEGGTESGKIRKIIWKGALNIWRYYPIFGSGVETYAYSYPAFRPPEHNQTSEWEYIYNKAHNEYLNFASTTGIVGLLSYITLIVTAIYLLLRESKIDVTNFANNLRTARKRFSENSRFISNLRDINGRIISLALFSGYTSILVTNFFGFSVVPTALLFFIYPAIAYSLGRESERIEEYKTKKLSAVQKSAIIFSSSLALLLLYSIGKYWYADFAYAKGRSENEKGQYAKATQFLENAISLSPNESLYYDELAYAYSESAIYLFDEDRDFGVEELVNAAIKHSDLAVNLSPRNLSLKKSRARLFINIALIEPEYLFQAKDALVLAAALAPTDAKVLYDLALTTARTSGAEEAIKILKKTISLKPDYRDARFTLALLLTEKGETERARRHFEYILKDDPNDIFARGQLEELNF